jgi:PTH2 family peptidyl-tRNA hydrolase
MEYKMVVLVRKDLKISEGKLAVQVAHAAVTCALELKRTNGKWFSKWNAEGQKKVVLKVEDETELREFERLANAKDLVACTVQDAGLTEEGQKKVVLKVEDEMDLREYERMANAKNLVACTVQDAGLTEVPPGTTTCLGIGPAPEHLIDRLTGDLQLW